MAWARSGLLPVAAGLGAVVAARAARAGRRLDFRGRSVLITGGSRGLGLVLARELAGEGARLTLLARDAATLERAERELAAGGAEVLAIPCDVRDRGAVEGAVAAAVARHGRLDVVVNNAGVIQVGPLAEMTLADFEEALGVHFWGPLYVTLAALPHLRRQAGARVVNITSIGGQVAVPHLLPYSASKFAGVGLSDGLRAELAKEGIRVTTVVPGLLRTGSPPNARFKGRHRAEYAWFAISDALPFTSIDAGRAARQIIEACRYGDPALTITIQARAAELANRLFPTLTANLLALADRLLPGPAAEGEGGARSGWESQSAAAPSFLTQLSDRATTENNQRPPDQTATGIADAAPPTMQTVAEEQPS